MSPFGDVSLKDIFIYKCLILAVPYRSADPDTMLIDDAPVLNTKLDTVQIALRLTSSCFLVTFTC